VEVKFDFLATSESVHHSRTDRCGLPRRRAPGALGQPLSDREEHTGDPQRRLAWAGAPRQQAEAQAWRIGTGRRGLPSLGSSSTELFSRDTQRARWECTECQLDKQLPLDFSCGMPPRCEPMFRNSTPLLRSVHHFPFRHCGHSPARPPLLLLTPCSLSRRRRRPASTSNCLHLRWGSTRRLRQSVCSPRRLASLHRSFPGYRRFQELRLQPQRFPLCMAQTGNQLRLHPQQL